MAKKRSKDPETTSPAKGPNGTRAYAPAEARRHFLNRVHGLAEYWAKLPGKSAEERCRGLAFSILANIDGTGEMPALDLRLSPHPDDKEYHISQNRNWYEPGQLINDCQLHEEYRMLEREHEVNSRVAKRKGGRR